MDDYKLLSTQKEIPEIAIFGAGRYGTEMGLFLKKMGIPFFYLDNDKKKHNTQVYGEKVFSPEIVQNRSDLLVVLCCARINQSEMHRQISDLNCPCVTQDYFMGHYLTQIYYDQYGKLFIGSCQIVLTERCTLKCRKCAHACYAVSMDAEDMTINDVKESADSFFSYVDYVKEFTLIGGEPLLYADLNKAITYIGENYRGKIFDFTITTNGTIIPKERTLYLAKKYKITFRISNYSIEIPRLKDKYNSLCEVLQKSGVSYILNKEETMWFDYGFGEIDRKGSPEELRKVFQSCLTACHEARRSRLYYCVMARSVADNLNMRVGNDGFIDLDTLSVEEGKKKILDFIQGKIEKGYLDMCNYCRGSDAYNFLIPAAEQM